jgi:PhzF family phenazine biosynthesis protein
MKLKVYFVDAFTHQLFSGNPAAVCILPAWLSDTELQLIATENNLPVTAFLVREKNLFHIRWLTPEYELDICGHGMLAAAYIILNQIETSWEKVELKSRFDLHSVSRSGEFLTLHFLEKKLTACAPISFLEKGLNIVGKEFYQYKNERCFVVCESEESIRSAVPDIDLLKRIPFRGITITAPGVQVDFVSRTFYPLKLQIEDPVTGVTHCSLAPYWGERLDKTQLEAAQLSVRGGQLLCEIQGDRVLISGKSSLFLQGEILFESEG